MKKRNIRKILNKKKNMKKKKKICGQSPQKRKIRKNNMKKILNQKENMKEKCDKNHEPKKRKLQKDA